MFVDTLEEVYRKLAANPNGFRALIEKLIALEFEPMAWEADVRALKTPVLIATGDADVATLEHPVAMFRLLGGGFWETWARRLQRRASPFYPRHPTPQSSTSPTCCTGSKICTNTTLSGHNR